MSAAIEIRDLTKRFGKVTALNRLSLTVEPGEFLVLLGPSGCGKTTLLRCLAGLEEPDEGEITIGGNVVCSSHRGIAVPPGNRGLGMVFQSYALWPHMRVNENIGLGLRAHKISREETQERVDRVLQDLALDDLGERYPSELSGGQQQRVALARLLVTKPSVFLMDEPLSNLDARLRVDMRSELKRLHRDSHATTVFVTHDQTEAMTLASLVGVISEGRIQQLASPGEIYRQPANIFVANFIGLTSGSGTFHIPQVIFEEILVYLDSQGVDVTRGYGTGPSRKLELVQKGLSLLEIPNYIFHNIKRGYYLFPNVNNLYDVLHENKQPIWHNRPLNKLVKFWKERYGIPRSKRVTKWMLFDSNDYFKTIKKEIY